MDEMKNILEWAGFHVDGNKCYSPDASELEVINFFEKANVKIEEQELELIESNSVPFEEVIFNDGITDTASSLSEEGPKMVKKLGEVPTGTNNHGLSNSVSLALFLAIDVVAIFVGLFLLMH